MPKLGDVRRDHDGAQRGGMSRDQKVVGSDRTARGFELGTNAAVMRIRRRCQRQHGTRARMASTLSKMRLDPLFAAPYRSSAAVMMLMQRFSSPTLAMWSATLPRGLRIMSDRMLVSSM